MGEDRGKLFQVEWVVNTKALRATSLHIYPTLTLLPCFNCFLKIQLNFLRPGWFTNQCPLHPIPLRLRNSSTWERCCNLEESWLRPFPYCLLSICLITDTILIQTTTRNKTSNKQLQIREINGTAGAKTEYRQVPFPPKWGKTSLKCPLFGKDVMTSKMKIREGRRPVGRGNKKAFWVEGTSQA